MKNKIFVIITACILLASSLSGCTGSKTTTAEANDSIAAEEEKYIPVETEIVELKDISNDSTFSGKVYPDKEVSVTPKMPGKVKTVPAQVGTPVNTGSLLFTMDREDTEKQIEQTKKSVEMAWTNYERTKEQIDNAKTNYERTKQLYEQGIVSQSQYEQAKLGASEKMLETARVQFEQAQLSYQQVTDSLKDTSVTSPIKGIVAAVNISEGEMASTMQPAIVIVDLSKLYVNVDIPENIINELYVGQNVLINIPAAGPDQLSGKIETISPTSDARTQLYSVKVLVNNTTHVKPGMFAKVQISTNTKKNVLAIKSQSIIYRANTALVYVVENDRAVEKEIIPGLDTGTYIEILKGLNQGEMLLVKGQHYVENDSKVKIVRGDK